jgi:hypothetical protein
MSFYPLVFGIRMGTPSSHLALDVAPRAPYLPLPPGFGQVPFGASDSLGILAVTTQSQVAPKHAATRTAPYLLLVWIGLATALLVGVLLLVALRRSTLRPKRDSSKTAKATSTQSAWEESGKRLAMPPSAISEEPD